MVAFRLQYPTPCLSLSRVEALWLTPMSLGLTFACQCAYCVFLKLHSMTLGLALETCLAQAWILMSLGAVLNWCHSEIRRQKPQLLPLRDLRLIPSGMEPPLLTAVSCSLTTLDWLPSFPGSVPTNPHVLSGIPSHICYMHLDLGLRICF